MGTMLFAENDASTTNWHLQLAEDEDDKMIRMRVAVRIALDDEAILHLFFLSKGSNRLKQCVCGKNCFSATTPHSNLH